METEHQPLKTYGLRPDCVWKHGVYDGWGVLISFLNDDDDDEERYGVKIEVAFDDAVTIGVRMTAPTEEFGQKLFDAFDLSKPDNVRKAVQTVIDQYARVLDLAA